MKINLPKTDVSIQAVLRLVEYSNRLAQSQDKMLSNIEPLMDIVREATMLEKKLITKQHIDIVIERRNRLKASVEKNMNEQYKKDILLGSQRCLRRETCIHSLTYYGTDIFQRIIKSFNLFARIHFNHTRIIAHLLVKNDSIHGLKIHGSFNF